MSTFISILGYSHTGKTTVANILAKEITREDKSKSCIIVTLNETNSEYPILFPKMDNEKSAALFPFLYSQEYTKDELGAKILSRKDYPNIGYLSFSTNDKSYLYPTIDMATANKLILALDGLADYIIYDLQPNVTSIMSTTFIKTSDYLIKVSNQDLKSMSYHYIQEDYYSNIFPGEKTYKVFANMDKGKYIPDYNFDCDVLIPYSEKIKMAYYEGNITMYPFTKEGKLFKEIIKEIQNKQ